MNETTTNYDLLHTIDPYILGLAHATPMDQWADFLLTD